jgi:hypothetical protein
MWISQKAWLSLRSNSRRVGLSAVRMPGCGGSRGVGRQIVEAAARNGARVLAVARQAGPLGQLLNEVTGIEILSLDATDETAPAKVFDVFEPDILVLCAGAFPPRVAKKLKLQERRAVIPSRRSLAACRPLGFLGRSRAPSRIGGHTRGTYGVGTYPGLHHWDGGP